MTPIPKRILPLPKIAREALINKYCAAESRALVATKIMNRDFWPICIWEVAVSE
jgi:hypothetical protein